MSFHISYTEYLKNVKNTLQTAAMDYCDVLLMNKMLGQLI